MDARKGLTAAVAAAMLAAGIGGVASARRVRPNIVVTPTFVPPGGAGGTPGGGDGGIQFDGGGGGSGGVSGGGGGDFQGGGGVGGSPGGQNGGGLVSDVNRKTDVVAVVWD
jgi:hypothetical protein